MRWELDWIDLAHDRDQWRCSVNLVIKLLVTLARHLSTVLATVRLSRKN